MSLPVRFVPPVFSAVFTTRGNIPVPSAHTTFSSGDMVRDAFAIPSEDVHARRLEMRIAGISEAPRFELALMKKRFEQARQARSSGNLEDAFRNYRETLIALESPFEHLKDDAPLYRHIPSGDGLFKEALFETAVLSGPEEVPEMLNRLTRFIEEIRESEGTLSDIARATMIKAYKIMQHTMSAGQPKGALLKEAYEMVQRVRSDAGAGDDPDTSFYAGLLSVELLARSIAMAHNRRDFHERNLLIERQRETIKDVLSDHLTDDRNEAIASYIADSAILLARLGLWGPSLRSARTLTTRQFACTAGTRRVLTDPMFEPFIDSSRVLSPSEVKFRSSKGSYMKRLQAALALAHSKGIKESIFAGLFGLAAGFGASALFGMGGESTVAAAVAGAALLTSINRFRNGWNSLEARYAAKTGIFDRTAPESALDASRLILWGGLNAATWLLPAAVLNSGPESIHTFGDTIQAIVTAYSQLGAMAADGFHSIAGQSLNALNSITPEQALQTAYQTLISASAALAASSALSKELRESLGRLSLLFVPGASMFLADATASVAGMPPDCALDLAYGTYLKATAAFLSANLIFPSLRRSLSGFTAVFLPGGLMLSAEIGMHILGQNAGSFPDKFDSYLYADRIQRASIIAGGMLMMQLTAGLVPLRRSSPARNPLLATVSAMNPSRNPHIYMLPLTAAVVGAGIMSPIGGLAQGVVRADSVAECLVQGVAISLGLIPVTLTVGGLLNGFIPLRSRIRESWQDSRGLSVPRGLLEMGMGYLDSFRVPYVKNRLLRKFTMDLPAASLRALLGWDTNSGQLIDSSMSFLSGNAMATSTWPESSATVWEREAIVRNIGNLTSGLDLAAAAGREAKREEEVQNRDDAMNEMYAFFSKAGQVTHVLHPFMAHKSLSDRLWPVYAVSRSFRQPSYPQMPNVDFYASLHDLLMDAKDKELTAKDLGSLLDFVEHQARDPNRYEAMRPIVKTLALSRNSRRFGKSLQIFFEENQWIAEVMNVNLEKYKPYNERLRRLSRRAFKNRVRKRFDKYEQRVASHGRQGLLKVQFEGLFLADSEVMGKTGA
ncbi:MAG: hypothetical protein JXA24_06335 [Proteobacteria bacterium]|nr:hypothetical protein [Pseudomonadota bacterium]